MECECLFFTTCRTGHFCIVTAASLSAVLILLVLLTALGALKLVDYALQSTGAHLPYSVLKQQQLDQVTQQQQEEEDVTQQEDES